MNCLKVSAVAVFMLFYQFVNAQNFLDVQQLLKTKQKLLGEDVVTLISNKDTVLYQESPKLFTVKTQAPVGAVSQWLTAAVILALVDEGKLSMDDKVVSYLPVFEKYGKNYITIRHCLTHFTGIDANAKGKLFQKKFSSLEDEAASYAAQEIKSNPGTEFQYSNIGFAIAARVAEVATKKRFDMLAQQKLFRPLGMRQTTFTTLDAGAINSNSGARSTAADLMRFLRMLLNNGTLNSLKVLSEESVTFLRTVVTTSEPSKGLAYAGGAWAPEQQGAKAKVLMVQGLNGILPYVDFCRGYAFLVFVKNAKDAPKANMYAEVKPLLDAKFLNTCR